MTEEDKQSKNWDGLSSITHSQNKVKTPAQSVASFVAWI